MAAHPTATPAGRPSGAGAVHPAWRANARSLAIGYLIAAVAVVAVWVALLVLGDVGGRRALGLAAGCVGGALVLTGGNAVERLVTLSSSAWGVSVNRHRDLIGREYSDTGTMTSLGMAVLVGLPVLVAGVSLI